jgi:hypothetical protein
MLNQVPHDGNELVRLHPIANRSAANDARPMRLRDYFRGYSIELQSRHGREEVERRINAAALPLLAPFRQGVAGWARFGRLRLRYRSRFFSYDGAPILVGRLNDESGRTRLRLRFRAPLPIYLFFAMWYAFCLFFLAAFLVTGLDEVRPGEAAVAIGACLLLMLFPLGMHYSGTRRADEHFATLVAFLEEQAEAKRIARRA